MARRRRSRSPAQRALTLAQGVTILWIGYGLVALAPLTQFLLAHLLAPLFRASLPTPALTATLSQIPLANAIVFGGFAVIVLLAWWWAIRQLWSQNAAGKRLEELQALTPDAFEEWVAARFRELGYRVQLTGTQGDHGIDLLATKLGERTVVQCKNYRAWSVGEPVLRDLFGAMHAAGADRAYLVTTGRLTRPARTWARGKPIVIWDADTLARLSPQQPRSAEPQVPSASPHSSQPVAASACPKCGAELVQRRNRRTREPFLGCSRYPACHYTQPIAPLPA